MAVTSTFIPHGTHPTQVAGQLGNLTKPEKWQLMAATGIDEVDSLGALEGNDDKAFVCTTVNLGASEGTIVQMRTRSGFANEGVRGVANFTVNAQFEQMKFGQYGVLVGKHRHASSTNDAISTEMLIERELKDGSAVEEGKWCGRRAFENGAMTMRERIPAAGKIGVNGRDWNYIRSTDTLGFNAVVMANAQVKLYGGALGDISRAVGSKKQWLMKNLCLAPTDVLTGIQLDPLYQAAAAQAQERGASNPLWSQETVMVKNTAFMEHLSVLGDIDGPKGSVLAPEGVLNTRVQAGTGVIDILFGNVGGTPDEYVYYSKWFPGYNYIFNEYGGPASAAGAGQDTLGSPQSTTSQYLPDFIHGSAGTTENIATGGEHYLMILNPPYTGANGEPANAIGYYSYTVGNDGKKITITGRLGSATGGSSGAYRGRVTELMSSGAPGYDAAKTVSWGASNEWGGVQLTDVHPAGARIFPCNGRGVPMAWAAFMGNNALYRVWGKAKCKRGTENIEVDHGQRMFTSMWIGHRVRVNREGNPAALAMVHCARYIPGRTTPNVLN